MFEGGNELITKKLGYEAMLLTLYNYWKLTGSNDLTDILSGGEYWKETGEPLDSAFWKYWLKAINQAEEQGPLYKILSKD